MRVLEADGHDVADVGAQLRQPHHQCSHLLQSLAEGLPLHSARMDLRGNVPGHDEDVVELVDDLVAVVDECLLGQLQVSLGGEDRAGLAGEEQ